MGAELQWHCEHCATLRLGSNFKRHGDPYDASGTVVRHGNTIEIYGLSAHGILSLLLERQKIRNLLPSWVEIVAWDRIKDGKKKRVVWEIRKGDKINLNIKRRSHEKVSGIFGRAVCAFRWDRLSDMR